jgi:hypothetical protein
LERDTANPATIERFVLPKGLRDNHNLRGNVDIKHDDREASAHDDKILPPLSAILFLCGRIGCGPWSSTTMNKRLKSHLELSISTTENRGKAFDLVSCLGDDVCHRTHDINPSREWYYAGELGQIPSTADGPLSSRLT